MSKPTYTMNISLNVLNHLGINLYSNTPAVLAEVIANAWDADATRVDIDVDFDAGVVIISDNGCGMDVADINDRYLCVGYQRREKESITPIYKRKPMGRKGIGKLSLFSIAEKIHVQSKKDGESNALLMDESAIKIVIKTEETGLYHPESVEYDDALLIYEQGTAIKITKFKSRFTKISDMALRQRIARRFSVVGVAKNFDVFLNGEKITYADRNYFHKARFLFQYGEEDFSKHCKKLDCDANTGESYAFTRPHAFDQSGKIDKKGHYKIKGWIGIAKHSNDLDDPADNDENLNNIVIVARGKIAQEDILHQYRKGGLITKYIYGEIQADFLDDGDVDIATSSRQKIIEDALPYIALKSFLDKELDHIWNKTNKLKEKKGVENALKYHPEINKWYATLTFSLKKKADVMFGAIEKIPASKKDKATMYVNGILAFEKMKMEYTFDRLDSLDPDHIESVLAVFQNIDDIEAAHYYEIVNVRLKVVKALQSMQTTDQKEKIIQKYIFDHLWLLHPSWERATGAVEMEKTIQRIVADKQTKDKKTVQQMRVDIQYRKAVGAHVIVELKRASVRTSKTDLEAQITKYMDATREKLDNMGEKNLRIEGVCVVGKLPTPWNNPMVKQRDIESLKPLNIKILTYDELINSANSGYSEFIAKREDVQKLRDLIQAIRDIPTSDDDDETS